MKYTELDKFLAYLIVSTLSLCGVIALLAVTAYFVKWLATGD